jgi:hypothetical protein
MRKVVMAYAAESPTGSACITALRARVAGHVQIVDPPPGLDSAAATTTWFVKAAKDADFILILYCRDASAGRQPLTQDTLDHALSGPDAAAPDTDASYGCAVRVDRAVRARLPGDAPILIALHDATDKDLPPDLRGFDRFDLARKEGEEALACRLAHDPLTPRAKLKKDAIAAAQAGSKLCLGVVATLIGTMDTTQDFMVANVNDERIRTLVHVVMMIVVMVLLFSGLVAILQMAMSLIREAIASMSQRVLPGSSKTWEHSVWIVTAGLVALYACRYMPSIPNVPMVVEQKRGQWVQRLTRSQMADGGFRIKSDQSAPKQVWTTAQCLAGLLTVKDVSTRFPPASAQRAFDFIDRAQIRALAVKPESAQNLAKNIAQLEHASDLLLPHVLSFSGFEAQRPLRPETMRFLEAHKADYFSTTESAEGWAYFDPFNWGVTEIAAWVTVAQVQALRAAPAVWPSAESQDRQRQQIRARIQLLLGREISTLGAYSPIRDNSDPAFARTYSTLMALWAIAEATSPDLRVYGPNELQPLRVRMERGARWLTDRMLEPEGVQTPERHGGWKGNPANVAEKPYLGLTAHVLFVLGRLPISLDSESNRKILALKQALIHSPKACTSGDLSTNDRGHDADRYLLPHPLLIETSTFLWYPWCTALMRSLSHDPGLSLDDRELAGGLVDRLYARAEKYGDVVEKDYNYVAAEALIGLGWPSEVQNDKAP